MITISVIRYSQSNSTSIIIKNSFFLKVIHMYNDLKKKHIFNIIKQATFLLLFRFLIINFFVLKEEMEIVRGFPLGGMVFLIISIVMFLLFLGVVAFYTLLERKVIAAVQRREGPNVSGPFGILQPLMDGIKLILKELNPSNEASADSFDLAPVVSFTISFAS